MIEQTFKLKSIKSMTFINVLNIFLNAYYFLLNALTAIDFIKK